nr:ATP-binding cassette domain-containing protein [uncultured Shinella sp.]
MSTASSRTILRQALHRVRYIFLFSLAFSFFYNLLRLTGPLFMILVYDRVLSSRAEETLIALFVLVAALLVLMALIDYSRRRIMARFGAQFQEAVETGIFQARNRNAYLTNAGPKPAPELNELDRLRSFFHSGSLIAILDFIWSPIFLIPIFILHASLGWIVVAGLLLILIVALLRQHFVKDYDLRATQASDTVSVLREQIGGSRHVIRSHEMTAAFIDRWMAARRDSRDRAIELKDWDACFEIGSKHLAMLLQYTLLAVGAYHAIKGDVSIGAMVATNYLAVRVVFPFERFLGELPRLQESIADWRRLDTSLNQRDTRLGTAGSGELAASVTLGNLYVRSATTRQQILRGVSLDIGPGTSVEITGRTGSGKTVLAEAILGRLERSNGTVLIGGIQAERLSLDQARSTIGYVPQTVSFLPGTLEDNIAGFDRTPDPEALVAAARLAAVHDLIMSLPEGYKTSVDAAGGNFSKSERHMIAFARALYRRPKILVLDEPDQVLREGLPGRFKDFVTDFLAGGGIMIIFSRKGLQAFQSQRRFAMAAGQLKETLQEGMAKAGKAGNVVKLDSKHKL